MTKEIDTQRTGSFVETYKKEVPLISNAVRKGLVEDFLKNLDRRNDEIAKKCPEFWEMLCNEQLIQKIIWVEAHIFSFPEKAQSAKYQNVKAALDFVYGALVGAPNYNLNYLNRVAVDYIVTLYNESLQIENLPPIEEGIKRALHETVFLTQQTAGELERKDPAFSDMVQSLNERTGAVLKSLQDIRTASEQVVGDSPELRTMMENLQNDVESLSVFVNPLRMLVTLGVEHYEQNHADEGMTYEQLQMLISSVDSMHDMIMKRSPNVELLTGGIPKLLELALGSEVAITSPTKYVQEYILKRYQATKEALEVGGQRDLDVKKALDRSFSALSILVMHYLAYKAGNEQISRNINPTEYRSRLSKAVVDHNKIVATAQKEYPGIIDIQAIEFKDLIESVDGLQGVFMVAPFEDTYDAAARLAHIHLAGNVMEQNARRAERAVDALGGLLGEMQLPGFDDDKAA